MLLLLLLPPPSSIQRVFEANPAMEIIVIEEGL